MSIAAFILSRMAPVATVGASAATAQTAGKKFDGRPVGTAILVAAKTVENFVAAIFLSIGAFWLFPTTSIPLLTVVFGHVLVLTPTLFALASHIGKKQGYDLLAERADQIDAYVQRFSKAINIAIYGLVTVVGTWSTYQWVASQIKR